MKRVVSSFWLILFSIVSFGQNENDINKMLEECIKKSKQDYEVFSERTNRNYSLYLCCDGLPSKYIQSNKAFYDSIGLTTITWHYSGKFQKELERGIDVMEIHYYLKGNIFEVYVHFITATEEKDEIVLAYWFEDVDKYVYEYSCETNEWRLKE